MKKLLFFLVYFLSPVVPLLLYINSLGGGFDSYILSVSLGIIAYVFICNQFILAARPRFIVNLLGLKGLLSFHGMIPVLVLILGFVHKILKEFNGFSKETLQASLGSVAWWLFAIVIVFTLLFMANTFLMRSASLSSLKKWMYAKTGLNYKKARLLHNITVVLGVVILIHVLLASSSDFTYNPAGFLVMAAWMLFSLGLYLRYRIKGRKV